MGTTDNMTEKEMTEEIKESRMTVRMTKEALYDFLLFHAYSKFSGFLVIFWDWPLYLWEFSLIPREE